jgi:TRAP-type C4-dicarboxylate transport system substrate-binding protein
MAFMLLGPVSSQFPKTAVATLPFEVTNGAEAGAALWALYEKGLIADELRLVKPLAIGAFPNVSLHAKQPLTTLDSLRGIRVSVQSRLLSETMTALGVTPVTMPVSELYQALSRGVIDGTAIGWPATTTYKTHEVVGFHTDVPLGGEVVFEIMNKSSYDKLPAPARAAIDRMAGPVYVKRMGEIIDVTEKESRDIILAAGQKILPLAPDESARWRQRIAPITDAWVKATPNGAAVLAAFRSEIAAYRSRTKDAAR